MNRILHWLTVKLSRPIAAETVEQPDPDDEERDFGEDDNPGEPVTIGKVQTDIDDLTPNIYREAAGDTQPELEIIESPSPISNLSESFDPYDSGSFKVLKK
jgi:hypothetical protein